MCTTVCVHILLATDHLFDLGWRSAVRPVWQAASAGNQRRLVTEVREQSLYAARGRGSVSYDEHHRRGSYRNPARPVYPPEKQLYRFVRGSDDCHVCTTVRQGSVGQQLGCYKLPPANRGSLPLKRLLAELHTSGMGLLQTHR